MATLQAQDSGRRLIVPARCLIGRSHACDLVLDARDVSSQHAIIQWAGKHWELQDLDSRNGTFVADLKLASGSRSVVREGAKIRFGRESEAWELRSDAGPELMALALGSSEALCADGGYLVLPNPQSPEYCIYQSKSGDWIVEHQGEPSSLADRAVCTTADAKRWRIYLPSSGTGTWQDDQSPPAVADLLLRFAVSSDEEYVEILGIIGERRLDLLARAHHYPLLILARRRVADQAAGLPEPDQGWIRLEDLMRMLRMDENHLNISIHRARTQIGRLGVADAACLVERRPGTRQIRIGVRELEFVQLEAKPRAPELTR